MADYGDPLSVKPVIETGRFRVGKRSVLLLVAVVAATSCFDDGPPIGPGKVVAVRVFPDTLVLAVGATGQLSAAALDGSVALVAAGSATWSSADPAVADVDGTGLVNAASLGTTTVSATIDGVEGTAAVVVRAPEIVLSPGVVSFSATAGGPDPASRTVQVSNGGPGSLTGLAVAPVVYGPGAQGWLSATLAPDSAPATITLQPATGSLLPGVYDALVTVSSGVASNSPQTVDVNFVVAAPPSGNPGQLAVVTQPGGATANTTFTQQPVIEIRDSAGTRVFGATNQVAAVIVGGDGTLIGTMTVAAVNGQAVFTDLAIRGAQSGGDTVGFGDHQLQFTSPGLTAATSASFNVGVSFAYNVQYLFNQPLGFVACLGCHNGFNVASALVNQAATVNAGCGTLVVPGNAASSFLMQKLDGSQASGCGSVMPTSGALSAALRDLVRRWITEGAKNN